MTQDTPHRTAKFISSQQPVSSEIQKRIINLGKAFVEELGSDWRIDTLSRWMAHYIAEQMTIVENATGDDKVAAEQRCFESILKLWQHRLTLPDGRRPFEDFEPVFRTLARLDPENQRPFFYTMPRSIAAGTDTSTEDSAVDESGEDSDEVQQWLGVALGIDRGARILIEYAFHQAALSATNDETITWLENAVNRFDKDDISVIIKLNQVDLEDESEEGAEQEKQAKQEKLRSRIKRLDAFIEFSQALRSEFMVELEGLAE